ncbi:MAG: SPOR domain-containing protein [Lentimicrobium sp.]|jgi:cell division septation protein DedD|nr:SPOR domain-containing protein [Lentimicrobium sp.]MDD2527231.1 SPOR domain-containing protein [Lentimicrobiaceae bacterium]MDD4596590.1 SPOR domain-containing protein [Lentimicrobiaceae bacterium]MDY0024885.1 SPOR domain-containing protein [Lentimicrobium sp.]HAH57905.1 hypothetical protein [Bacteroidales bacterium]
MIGIKKEIAELLRTNDCVIVPGLGGFVANYLPAFIHPEHHTFNPPSRQIAFNARLNTNDGLLANYIGQKHHISYTSAMQLIDREVISTLSRLSIGDKITIESIGLLCADKENQLQFIPQDNLNLLDDAFGLPNFISPPIDRSPLRNHKNSSVRGLTTNKQLRVALMRAAIFLPFAALSVWALINPDKVTALARGTASLWPSAVEHTIPRPANTTLPASTYEIKPAVNEETKSIETPALPEVNATVKNDVYFIIAGAFGVKNNADNLVSSLKNQGYDAKIIGINPQGLHMVSLAGYSNKKHALEQLNILRSGEIKSAWLLTQK